MVGPPRPLQKDQAPPGGRAPPRHKRRPGRQESWAGHRAITLLSRACEGAGGIRSGIDPDDVPLLMLGFLWRIDPSGDWETRAGESMSIRPPITSLLAASLAYALSNSRDDLASEHLELCQWRAPRPEDERVEAQVE